MEGNLRDAIAAVPTMDIVEEFGIYHKQRGANILILCPGHDDQRLGSCLIDRKDDGYYCYACAEHVSKWDMLRKVSGYSGRSAAEWFFQRAGITPTKQVDPLARILKFIKQVAVHIDNSPVYDDKYVCAKVDSTYGRIQKGEYLYSDLASNNPLLELYKINPNLFVDTVTNAIRVKQEEQRKVADFCASHMNDIVMTKGAVKKNIAYSEIRQECLRKIDDLETFVIEAQEWKI